MKHPIVEDIDRIVARIRTQSEAVAVRAAMVRLRENWRDHVPAWFDDPLALQVDRSLTLAIEKLQEVIDCHGQC